MVPRELAMVINQLSDFLRSGRFKGPYQWEEKVRPVLIEQLRDFADSVKSKHEIVVQSKGIHGTNAYGVGFYPDAALLVDSKWQLAIELKLINEGGPATRNLASGIGQCIIYRNTYNASVLVVLDWRSAPSKGDDNLDPALKSSFDVHTVIVPVST